MAAAFSFDTNHGSGLTHILWDIWKSWAPDTKSQPSVTIASLFFESKASLDGNTRTNRTLTKVPYALVGGAMSELFIDVPAFGY